MTKSAASLEYGRSELELIEAELVEFEGSELPRLKSCKVAMECHYHSSHEVGPAKQAIIYGEIKKIYLDPEIVTVDGSRVAVDAVLLDPISRLGGAQYGSLGEICEVKRPK